MAHPFEKLFYKALKKCTVEHNEVVVVATGLLHKGYSPVEIATVLEKLKKFLIDKDEAELLEEAYADFAQYLED